jgi:methionyl-tRNA formyltransferase
MIKVKPYCAGTMGMLAHGVLEQLVADGVIEFDTYRPDITFSASWPEKIDKVLREEPRLAAVNIHTGLLPEGRGSNPLNWALIWGKDKTGITIHHMTETYDAGDIIMQEEVPIFDTDTIVQLRERVETIYPKLIALFFSDPLHFLRQSKSQDQALASYAQKRRPEDSKLNLSAPPRHIYNLWRSCDPVKYPAFVVEDGMVRVVDKVEMLPSGTALVWFTDGSSYAVA